MAISSPIEIQGEALDLVNAPGSNGTGNESLSRTRTQNQERHGLNGLGTPDDSGTTQDDNTGAPNFDDFGLRPDYTGEGYLDINGPSGTKAQIELPLEAGTYDVIIRLANGSSTSGTNIANRRPIEVAIDGVSATIDDTRTTEWYLWEERTVTLTLDEATSGPRVLTIATQASNGPNIDALAIVNTGEPYAFPDPLPIPDLSADADGNLAAVPGAFTVGLAEAGSVDFTLTGIDDDITGLEVSTDGGATFVPAILGAVTDGSATVAVDLGVVPSAGPAEVLFRVTDGSSNIATASATVDLVEGSVIAEIEAESFTIVTDADADTAAATNQPGFSGAGFLDMGGEVGDTVSFDVTAAQAGPHTLLLRYATSSDRPMALDVNASGSSTPVPFASTGDFETWVVQSVEVDLAVGANTITLANTVANGPNIDRVAVVQPAPAIDTPPTAIDGTGAGAEDATAIVIDVADLADDAEDAAEPVIVSAFVDPAAGTVGFSGTELTFVPAADFNGPAAISYTVEDSAQNAASATVTVDVAPVNDAPTLSGSVAPATVASATGGLIDLSSLLAADVDGTTPSLAIANSGDLPAEIALIDGDLAIAAEAAPGTYAVQIVATDTEANSAEVVTVSVTVEDPPVVPFETVYIQAEDGVPGASNTAATTVRDADNLETSGGLRPDFSGTGYVDYGSAAGDAYTYTFEDTEGGARTLYLRYASSNDRPLAVVVNGVTVNAGVPFADTDPDGSGSAEAFDTWVLTPFDITTTVGTNTVTLEIPASGGNAPNVDALAIAKPGEVVSFFAPEIDSAPAFVIDENTTEVGQVVAGDTDGNGVTFALSGVDQDKVSIDAEGILTLNAAPDFETPADANEDGVYEVTVEVTGDGETVTQDATITLVDVDPELAEPVIAPIVIQSETATIASFDDATFHRTQTENPENGNDVDAFGLKSDYSGFGYTDFNGDGPNQAVSYNVTVSEDGSYDLTIRYASNTAGRALDLSIGGVFVEEINFVGLNDSFTQQTTLTRTVALAAGENTITLSVPDGDNNGPNIDAIAVTTVGETPVFPASNVQPTFDAPTPTITVAENVTGVIGDFAATDLDLDTVVYRIEGDDEALFTIDAAGQLSFAAAPDFETSGDAGPDQNSYAITVIADDGKAPPVSQAVTVFVTDVDEAPVLSGAATGTVPATGGTVELDGLTATDPENGPVTLALASPVDGFSINAENDLVVADSVAPGSYSIAIVANDGTQDSGSVLVDVTVEEPEPVTLPVTFNAASISGYSSQDKPSTGDATVEDDGATLILDGNLWKRVQLSEAYQITADTVLTLQFETGTLPEIVGVGVDAGNDPFAAGASIWELAGSQSTVRGFTDLRGTPAVTDLGNGLSEARIDLSGRAGETIASLVFLADDDQPNNGLGSATFRNVVLSDEPAPAQNTAPRVVGGGIADIVVDEDATIEVDLPFVDDQGDPISYQFTILDGSGADVTGQFGQLSIDGNVLSGDLGSAAPGTYTVDIVASDPDLATSSTQFVLMIEDVNEAPVAGPAAFEPVIGKVGVAIAPIDTADFVGIFSDPDNDFSELSFSVEGLPAGLSVNAEGVITGTPTDAGDGSFHLIATDPEGLTASIEIALLINAPEVGDVTIVEAEDFTGLGVSSDNFFSTGQSGASGNQIIRSSNNNTPASVTTDLAQNGVSEGWYIVSMTRYDETDDSADYSLQIGDTLLAENAKFDGIDGVETTNDTFDNSGPRGAAGQATNIKTVVFDTPVFVTQSTLLTLSGQANAELLRTDKFTFTRTVTPNIDPGTPVLDTNTVAENAAGATVGTLSATDPDGDPAAIVLSVDPASDFEVIGDQLKLKDDVTLDFESTASVDVVVTATDPLGGTATTTLTVAVGDVDEAPTAPLLSAAEVAENAPGAVIGTLSATDPEGGDITFTVSDARFEVAANGELQLAPGAALDHETEKTVTLDITATDDGGLATTQSFDVTVTDVNDAPTLGDPAALNDVSVANGAGATIDLSGLAAADEDDGQTPVYAVTSAVPLPSGFEVQGTDLIVPTDAPAGTYEIEVFAIDGTLGSDSVLLTVTVGDPTPFEPFAIQAEDETLAQVIVLDDGANTTVTTIRDPQNPETNPNLTNGLRPDFSGTGYLDFGDFPGDAIVFTVTVPAAGDYDLNVRYASQGDDRPLDLSVNSGAATSLPFSTTDLDGPDGLEGFDQWGFETQTVTLAAGANTIALTIPAGASSGPNIDRIEITEAGTGPIPAPDTTADENGDLAAASEVATVAVADLSAVEIRLAGVDADITGFEISVDGGTTFVPTTAVADGADQLVTLDLTGTPAGSTLNIVVRVTDGTNFATATTQVAVESETITPIDQTLQLEARNPDDSPAIITIDDTDLPGGGENNSDLTQIRDSMNPETVTQERGPDGLWDGFTGTGYLDMGGNIGDAVEFSVNVPEAGDYTFTFRYAQSDSSGDRPMTLTVDGAAPATLQFSDTGGFDSWDELAVTVALEAGDNVIRLANDTANGPNLDSVNIFREGTVVTPPSEPGPRDTILINFQDGTAPKADGYLVGNFDGFGLQSNGLTYGFVTEASAVDADGTTNTPINGGDYPAIAINERLTGEFADYDPRLQGYAHFDLGSYPGAQDDPDFRVGWEIALANGWYEVTVAVGDTGGANDSDNRLFVEGELATAWTATDAFKSQLVTTLADVQDGHLTLSAQGGTITEMQYLEIRELPDLTPDDGNEAPDDYASFVNARAVSGVGSTEVTTELDPGDGVRPEGIDPSSDIFIDVNIIDGRGGVLLESLNDGSVKLFETLTGIEVPTNINTTGGFDSLTVSPLGELKENTSYTLLIDGFQDRGPIANEGAATREFQKFSTSFVTGEAAEVVDRDVAFTDTVELNGASDGAFGFTSVEVSPDQSKIYVVTIGGQMKSWDLNPDGSLDVASEQTFTPMGDFVVDPNDAVNGRRGFIGITFDPEDENVIWVTDNAPIPLSGRDPGVPDFSGRISKVELGPNGSLGDATITPYITGLPRSNGDHVTNSLEFRANPDAGVDGTPNFLLYLIQGSNSAMGEADSAWGFRPERLLNAAVMEIDHTRDAPAGGFNVSTEPLPDDNLNRRFADSDGDLKNGGILIQNAQDPALNGNFLHFDENGVATVREGADPGSALVQAYYDPFADDAVLSIFSTGQRNAYDLVWHSNGFLYVPTNGSAGGGVSPNNPDTPANEQTSHPTQDDYLFRVEEGGYYGHPNPLRDEFILNGGNPTNGSDPNETGGYPILVDPDPNYDLEGSYSLGKNRSPNGATEYTSNVFGNSLQGAVLFTEYSGGDDVRVVLLGADGTPVQDFVLQDPGGATITYTDPLDIVEGANGQLYLITLNRGNGQSQLVRLDPAPGGVVADTTADAGNDLALTVVDGSDPAAVLFAVAGFDDDIVALTVDFGAGAQTVTLNAQNQFTADLSGETGPVTATLSVQDGVPNTATAAVTFTPGETPGPQTFYDGDDFTNLDVGSTIIRTLEDPSTLEFGNNDADGDGLNDGADGDSYVDFGGGVGDKASLNVVVAVAGIYDIVLRMANGSGAPRPIDIKLGDQVVSIADTQTGDSFTDWAEFPIQLTLQAGSNVIVFEQTAAVGGPNIDSATVTLNTPMGVPNDGIDTVDGIDFAIYEAENAALDGPTIETEDRTQSGDFVDYQGPGDETVTWTVSAAEAGQYRVDVLYALASDKAARPMDLSVNGTSLGDLPFPPNSNQAETLWTAQTVFVSLDAGTNTIALTAPGGNGPNLDYLRVSQTPVDLFVPSFATIDGDGRIELEATDDTTRTLDADTVEFYFTVAADGVYALDLAANGGAPDGGGLSLSLAADGGLPVNVEDTAFPGVGDAGESTVFTELVAGVEYKLTVQSDAPGANAIDYLDVRVAPGNENADIAVQSLDPTYFEDRLHFSFVNNSDGRASKETAQVEISNTGTETLDILDVEISEFYSIVDPVTLEGTSIAAGGSIVLTVAFDGSTGGADGFTARPNNVNGVCEGVLTLRTNDADSPVATVDLAAFWQPAQESGNEPNVNEVWQVLGFGNEIANLPFAGGGENSILDFDDLYLPAPGQEGIEILSPYWRIADGVTEVRATMIAAYNSSNSAGLGIHNPGNKGQDTNLTAWGPNSQSQTLFPLEGNGSFATELFDTGDIPDAWLGNELFGIEMAGLSTDPSLNPSGNGTPSQNALNNFYGQGTYTVNGTGASAVVTDASGEVVQDGYTVRMFQALDADGNAIENVYLGMMDYTGINYDYNDNMFIFEGITPVGAGGALTISGLDDAAADDRLVFTNIDNPNNGGGFGGQAFRDTATFTITNDGIGNLDITGFSLGGVDAADFQVSGTLGVLGTGDSTTVTVTFVGSDPADDGAAELRNATLTVESDAFAGDQVIQLAGLAQLQSESGEEPTVAQIVEALGYSTDVAQAQLNGGGVVETVGDEVLLPYLQRLDSGQPVEVINLAAFLQQGDISRLNLHGLDDDGLTELFAGDDNQGQTVLPDGLVSGPGDIGSVGRASIDSDDPFGLKVTVDGKPTFAAWSDPVANTLDPAFDSVNTFEGHYIRFFQAKDAVGQVIEGTFIGIQDYPGGGNFDYNDAMFLVKNVQGYDPTPAEDGDGDGINDALQTDADGDGLVAFFDADDTPVVQPDQAAFNPTSTPWAVGSAGLTLDANQFDVGGQGVAYNDTTPASLGDTSVRPGEAVDISVGTGAIGFTAAGEWVEYTIAVAQAGAYTLSFSSSSPIDGRALTATFANAGGVYESVTVDVPDTGAYTNYADTPPVTVALQAGVQVLRVNFDLNQQDLAAFTLTPADPPNAPPTTNGITGAPGAQEDAAFSFDVSGFFGDADADDTLTFSADDLPPGLAITPAGVLSGTPTADGVFTVNVTASDGEASVSTSFALSVADAPAPGAQTPFPGPDAPAFAGGVLTIEAAEFDDGGQGVAYNDAPGLQGGSNGERPGSDVEITSQGDVGWIADSEWLEYTIEVPADGVYNAELLMALNSTSGPRTATMEFFQPGASTPYETTGPVANPATGGWTTFDTRDAGAVSLQAGTQVVRVTFEGGSQDIRSFTLTQQVADPNAAPVTLGIADQDADENAAFSFDANTAFSDPDTDPLSFTASGLPDGLTISPQGVITGTPTQTGIFTVTVTASDGALSTPTTFDLEVDPAPGPVQEPFPGPAAPTFSGGLLTVDATNFDSGGQGVSWNDAPGLDGGSQSRGDTDVELVGGQQDIGYVEAGEWVEYTINVPVAGTYALSLNAKSPIAGNSIEVSANGQAVLATFALPDANAPGNDGFGGTAFGNTAPIEVTLDAGVQTLRFTYDGTPASNGYLLDMRSFTLEEVAPTVPDAVGLAGNVTFAQTDADTWFSVVFDEALDDPSVVMGPVSLNGDDPGAMRVRNVTDTGFEYQFDEWDYLDGAHTAETVSWIAVERGVHTLSNGATIEAGLATGGTSPTGADFAAGFGSAPIVLGQAASTNDPSPITTRIDAVSADSFSFSFEEEEGADNIHADEDLNWIAVSEGSFASLFSGLTGDTVTDAGQIIAFPSGFDANDVDEVVFLAAMQSLDGGDTTLTRLSELTTTSATVYLDEEQSLDSETGHTDETVGWLVLSDGVIA